MVYSVALGYFTIPRHDSYEYSSRRSKVKRVAEEFSRYTVYNFFSIYFIEKHNLYSIFLLLVFIVISYYLLNNRMFRRFIYTESYIYLHSTTLKNQNIITTYLITRWFIFDTQNSCNPPLYGCHKSW